MTRLAVVLALAAACGAPPAGPLYLRTEAAGPDTRLTLMAEPGLRLNARLKPALELAGGGVVRFDSPRLTADSAYFAEPPTTLLAGRRTGIRGKLRASVCPPGESVCRTVEVDL
jgi:hypothetical protein